jgi:hypothetical protein
MNELRIFVPAFGGIYYVESPWVQLPNGERSRKPINGQPQHKDTIWTEEQEHKGVLVIDRNIKAKDCYTMTITGAQPNGQAGVEYGQINATVTAASDSEAKFTVGLPTGIPAFIPGANYATGAPTISGTYGVNSLKAIGDLAQLNGIVITRIHHNASNDIVYATSPELVTVTSLRGKQTMPFDFPKSNSDDENTSIRDMDAQYLKSKGFEGGLRLNGMNYLTYVLPMKENLTLTFYTVFTPK